MINDVLRGGSLTRRSCFAPSLAWLAPMMLLGWVSVALAEEGDDAPELLTAPAHAIPEKSGRRPAVRSEDRDEARPSEDEAPRRENVSSHVEPSPRSVEATMPELDRPSEGTPSLSFDLLGKAEAPPAHAADASIEQAVSARRTMLSLHQAVGLSTVALLGAAAVVGQLNYNDRFSGRDSAIYQRAHHVLAFTAEGDFALTGLLALFAPEPYEKPAFSGFDTTTIHKVSMLGATLSMAAELVLGVVTWSRQGYDNQLTLARIHLVNGWAAFGFMAVGSTALVF